MKGPIGDTPKATHCAAFIRAVTTKGDSARFKKHECGVFVAGRKRGRRRAIQTSIYITCRPHSVELARNPFPCPACLPQSLGRSAYRLRRRALLASAIATNADKVAGLGTTETVKLPLSLNGPMASVTKTSVLNVPLMRTEP